MSHAARCFQRSRKAAFNAHRRRVERRSSVRGGRRRRPTHSSDDFAFERADDLNRRSFQTHWVHCGNERLAQLVPVSRASQLARVANDAPGRDGCERSPAEELWIHRTPTDPDAPRNHRRLHPRHEMPSSISRSGTTREVVTGERASSSLVPAPPIGAAPTPRKTAGAAVDVQGSNAQHACCRPCRLAADTDRNQVRPARTLDPRR